MRSQPLNVLLCLAACIRGARRRPAFARPARRRAIEIAFFGSLGFGSLASVARRSIHTRETRAVLRMATIDAHLHAWSSMHAYAPGKEPPSALGDEVASAEALLATMQRCGVRGALVVQRSSRASFRFCNRRARARALEYVCA